MFQTLKSYLTNVSGTRKCWKAYDTYSNMINPVTTSKSRRFHSIDTPGRSTRRRRIPSGKFVSYVIGTTRRPDRKRNDVAWFILAFCTGTVCFFLPPVREDHIWHPTGFLRRPRPARLRSFCSLATRAGDNKLWTRRRRRRRWHGVRKKTVATFSGRDVQGSRAQHEHSCAKRKTVIYDVRLSGCSYRGAGHSFGSSRSPENMSTTVSDVFQWRKQRKYVAKPELRGVFYYARVEFRCERAKQKRIF